MAMGSRTSAKSLTMTLLSPDTETWLIIGIGIARCSQSPDFSRHSIKWHNSTSLARYIIGTLTPILIWWIFAPSETSAIHLWCGFAAGLTCFFFQELNYISLYKYIMSTMFDKYFQIIVQSVFCISFQHSYFKIIESAHQSLLSSFVSSWPLQNSIMKVLF